MSSLAQLPWLLNSLHDKRYVLALGIGDCSIDLSPLCFCCRARNGHTELSRCRSFALELESKFFVHIKRLRCGVNAPLQCVIDLLGFCHLRRGSCVKRLSARGHTGLWVKEVERFKSRR